MSNLPYEQDYFYSKMVKFIDLFFWHMNSKLIKIDHDFLYVDRFGNPTRHTHVPYIQRNKIQCPPNLIQSQQIFIILSDKYTRKC